jgi:hypothetical protein
VTTVTFSDCHGVPKRSRSRRTIAYEIEGGHTVTRNLKTCLAVRVLLLGAAMAATPAAAASFDGNWNVNITTRSGSCESGMSLPVRISSGHVASGGAASVSGRVADSGGIVVVVSSGYKSATGSGHLAANSGAGTWHGGPCSGTWSAQKL